jgi:hypothetical protein
MHIHKLSTQYLLPESSKVPTEKAIETIQTHDYQ